MNRKILGILQYILFLALGIFLVWWSVGKISGRDWGEIKSAIQSANYVLVIPVVAILLLSHFSRAIRWRILMEPLGFRPSVINTYLCVLLGYLANLAIPRLGEVLKCTFLSRYEKVPADKLVGTIVAERAFDLICLVIVLAITVFSQLDIIGHYATTTLRAIILDQSGHFNFVKLALTLGIPLLLLLVIRYFLHRFAHVHVIQRIKLMLKGIWQGLTSVRFVQHKGLFFFHTALIWICYLMSIWIGFKAIEQTSVYGMKASFSVLTMGSVGMIATQGGIGAYPLLVQETMMLYGLNENIAKAFGWLLWLVQFFMVLLFGFLSLVLLPVLNKNKYEKPGLHPE
ncbi:MAG: flippase-like domain-containing protein [Williamsia sp.]|nr:flippase-like domain-containing protein [Williamsia sp.]